MRRYLFVYLKGIAMGAADVVPGVSGGTIALILGIYRELIQSIDGLDISILKKIRQGKFSEIWKRYNGAFLLALFSGIATSVISLAQFFKWLLHQYPVLLWAFFFGLVIASILFVVKQVDKWVISSFFLLVISSLVSYWLTILSSSEAPQVWWYFGLCGFFAVIAMILPGISGAFILLLLGAYETVLNIINILTLGFGSYEVFWDALILFISLGIGAIIGLKVFSRFLNWMFSNYKNAILVILSGFMIGSLNKIWPWKNVLKYKVIREKKVILDEVSVLPSSFDGNAHLNVAIVISIIGFLVVLFLEKVGSSEK